MNCKHLSTIGTVVLLIGILLAMASRVTGDLGVFMLALLLWFGGIGVIYLADRIRRKENQKNPITEVDATVVGHRMVTHHSRYSSSNTFYMTFKPEDGSESLEFEVPESDYQDFGAGDKGPLRYRTWEYLSFCAKDLSDVKPLAPSEDEYVPVSNEDNVDGNWERAEKLLDMLTKKTREWWNMVKNRIRSAKQTDKVEKQETEEDDGILTHELDE